MCGVVGGFLFFTGGALEWWMNKGLGGGEREGRGKRGWGRVE